MYMYVLNRSTCCSPVGADPEAKGDIERGKKRDDRPPTDEIIPVYRRDCHEEVYCGSHTYPGRGVYLLKFDNSYSLWRSKTLYYRVYYTRWTLSMAPLCVTLKGVFSLSNLRLSMVGPPHHVVSWGFLQDILGIDVIPCLTYLYLSRWYLWYMIICTKIILWTMVLYQNLFHVIASKIIIYKHKLSSFWKSLLWELGASVSFLFLSFLEIVFHVLVDAVMVWREVMGTLYAVSSSGMTFWTCNMGQCVLIKSANSCSQVTDSHTI